MQYWFKVLWIIPIFYQHKLLIRNEESNPTTLRTNHFYLKQLQALHQIQALNGLSPATTLVNGVSNNTVSYQSVAPSQQFHPAVSVASNYASNPAAVAQTAGQIGSTANPYQGVGLSSATTATAQPSSAVSLLALQQLLATNGVNSMGSPAAQLAYSNGAQGKPITFYDNILLLPL